MTMIEDLQNLLTLHGIDTSKYTEAMLSSLVLEAKTLIDAEYVYDSQQEDYVPDFQGQMYMTEKYPLKTVTGITIDGVEVVPRKIKHSGIIYFDTYISGTLEVEYIVGLNEDDYTDTILPICLYIAKDNEGKNVASITEGDVTISYDRGSNQTVINSLIEGIRRKYGARVRFI